MVWRRILGWEEERKVWKEGKRGCKWREEEMGEKVERGGDGSGGWKESEGL